MSWQGLAFEERRAIETTLEILEVLAVDLNAGEPIPNALLGETVQILRAFTGERAGIGEMERALEALERGEAGSAGAFVVHARACVSLLRNQRDLEPMHQLAPDQPCSAAQSSTLRHFEHLLEGYAKWRATSRQWPGVTSHPPFSPYSG